MSRHRIYYAIIHTPTETLFPFIAKGASWYDFSAKNTPLAPRLFLERWRAAGYLTVYLKGPLGQDDEGNFRYQTPTIPRNKSDFKIVTVNMELSDV